MTVDPMGIGVLGFLGMLVLLVMGLPIALSMAIAGFGGTVVLIGFEPAAGILTTLPYSYASSWAFVVLPMFLLLGSFAMHAGIGESAYEAAHKWVGRLPGGLAIATSGAAALFGFASGSSLATAAMFGRIALPEMRKYNYDKGFACAAIATAGTLAALIPPSAMMVIYVMFTNVSLGQLMLAGIIPGLMVAASMSLTILVWTSLDPRLAPTISGSSFSTREKLVSIRLVGPLAVVILSVLGGIYLGVFTPTEGGALGAFVAFLMFLLRTRMNLALFWRAVSDAAGTTGMTLLLVIGAMIFSRFLTLSGLVDSFTTFLLSLALPPVGIIAIIVLIYLIMGSFLEAMAMLSLTLPLLFPAVLALGYDGIWFGILVVAMVEIGVITPPVGLNLYVVKAVAGDEVRLEDIFRKVAPFVVSYLIVVGLLVAFPDLALWLPGLVKR